jgi:putative two-component system response regulator
MKGTGGHGRTPVRALVLSVIALSAPLTATFAAPEWAESDGALLIWLPALLPPFLLAYYKGWHGASLALAGGMATLALTQAGTLLLDIPAPPAHYVFAILAILVAVAIGAGWIAELLHRERDAAERAALTDSLTGLPNRRHADVFLDASWGSVLRGREVAVILFDLDHFKLVNDTHGHTEGDRVLRALAGILSQRTRRSDLSARFGGEEFISILVDCPGARAVEFAESVRSRMGSLDFGWGRVTLSAGLVEAKAGMGSPDVLVASADRALYHAKERGRNQVVLAPAGPGPAGAPAAAAAPAPRATLDGCRVLLVDDDDLTLRATARMLQRLGCAVHATASSRDALARLSGGEAADVLVTDIIMPDMSGFTLADLAGKIRPGLPVLYVSGYPQEDVYWGGTPGVRSAFLGKPLDVEDVRAALLELLGPGGEAAAAGAPAETGAEPDTGSGQEGTKRRGRILIVDDEAAVVTALQRFFERSGYPRPIGLTDPRRVVDTLRSEEIDLIILDLAMGEMDGFDVLAAISGMVDAEEFLPVIMLTGSDDPQTRRRALAVGAMDFINKPFDPLEAEVRVRNLLHTRFLTQRVTGQRDALEDEVVARTSELADTRSEILYRLARAAEYRDDVTGRHAERVGLLASALGAGLGLPPREVDLLRRTAPLHDIGKIAVPDSILLKPGPLTDAEFEVMKSHTTVGAQILGGSQHRILEVARAIALNHHERWDAQGYPNGIGGDEIPLEARIVAVADSFDALTHVRPYKPALPPEEAIAEMRRCRGTHYDPAVVEALDAVRERVGVKHIHELAAPLDPLRDLGPGRSGEGSA